MKFKKFLVSALLASLIMLLVVPVSFAETASSSKSFSDINGSYAKDAIQELLDKGIVTGVDANGHFNPKGVLTRAEFVTMMVKALGLEVDTNATSSFTDVSGWAVPYIEAASKAGFISGVGNGKFSPNVTVTREMSATILVRALQTQGKLDDKDAKLTFTDADSISDWAKPYIALAQKYGLVKGNTDGTFNPRGIANREQAAVMGVNLIKSVALVQTVSYSKEGTYGPASGTETIKGNVSITTSGVTLQNTVINGNLLLAKSIGDGDVSLNNVTVKGTTTINGGGGNSVHLKDSVFVTIIVDKATGDIRIVAEGNTTVKEVTLKSGAKLESKTDSGTGFSLVKLTSEIPKDSVVTLLGTFDSVEVSSVSIQIKVPEGSIGKFTTAEGSEGVSLDLGKDAKIVDLVLDAVMKIIGDGKIENVTGDGAPAPSTPPSNNGGGSTTVRVSGITVTGTTASVLNTLQMNVAVLPSNATNNNVTWSVSGNNNIATISATGLLTAVTDGTVTVTATAKDGSGVSGTTTIAIVSDETGLADALANGAIANIMFANDIVLADKAVADYLQINRAVTINGGGYSLNKGIAVEASNVTLDHLAITPSKFYSDDSGDWYYGVMVGDVTGIRLQNLYIFEGAPNPNGNLIDSIGISDKTGSTHTEFTVDNTVIEHGWIGIIVDSPDTHATITNNEISLEKHAIYLENATLGVGHVTVAHNIIFNPVFLNGGATMGDGITLPFGTPDNVVTAILGTNTFEEGFNKVVVASAPVTLSSIEITAQPSKLTYIVGEPTLDITGLEVTGHYSDSTSNVLNVGVSNISGFNSSTATGSQTLTVGVGGQTATFTVSIIEPLLNPTLTVYGLNVGQIWMGYDPGMVFQANVNFAPGILSSYFTSAEISLYDGTTLLATNRATPLLLSSNEVGLTDLFGIGDAENLVADVNWLIGRYFPANAPTKAVFTLVDIHGATHIVEAPLS